MLAPAVHADLTGFPPILLQVGTNELLLDDSVRLADRAVQAGVDVILDVVPVVGETIAAGLGAWLVWEARNAGMSKWQMSRMMGNVGVDWLLGLIPFVGAIPDFFFRSNTRNLRMIKRHLDKHHPGTAVIEG